MVILLLGIVFSVRPDMMLLLYAIIFTLRDILIVRMKRFSSSSILSILSDTLILLLVAVRLRRRLKAKPSIAGRVRTR